MNITHHCLTHPLPDDFRQCYPYDKPESFTDESGRTWMRGMRKVTGDRLPGLKHTFVVGRDESTQAFVGVCWLCESETIPELAHFGWFLVVEEYRARGVGSRILDLAIERLESHNVEMVMLPTQTTTVLARGMYGRRGFKDVLTEENGIGCWMVRAPGGHYDRFFAVTGPVSVGPLEPRDYVAFDYLINVTGWGSRLYPMGLLGTARIVTFKPTWDDAGLFAARQGDRLVGVGVKRQAAEGFEVDVFAHDPKAMRALLESLATPGEAPLTCRVAKTDTVKREALLAAGFRKQHTETVSAPTGETITLDVFVGAHQPSLATP